MTNDQIKTIAITSAVAAAASAVATTGITYLITRMKQSNIFIEQSQPPAPPAPPPVEEEPSVVAGFGAVLLPSGRPLLRAPLRPWFELRR